ncbi:MAG: FAD-dependent oxidoreductase [Deltaproteobacteria bacterium]|nr:FAD-dependent oxidoreductase [Deltaproteobacteria bacterium]
MSLARSLGLISALSLSCTVLACAAPADDEDVAQDEQRVQTFPAKPADTSTRKHCDVIIAGGTTAAIAAAIAASDLGAKTCLVEPTEWIGGQLTASGVSAIDWAWHKVGALDVGAAAKARANVTPSFFAMAEAIGNPGACWVSKNCYEPKNLLTGALGAAALRHTQSGALLVLKQAVPKRVTVRDGKITSLVVVQRSAKAGVAWGGYDQLPSRDIPDWYEERGSARYDKQVIELVSGYDRPAIYIDATEWGELLALSNAPYIQGVEAVEGSRDANDRCGQAIVFPFVEKMNAAATADVPLPEATAASKAFYSLSVGANETNASKWDKIWRYRRIRGSSATAQVGDLSEQNWNPGNDYPFGYLFLSKSDTAAQRSDWRGGIDLSVVAGAERHAFGWHQYFKAQGGEIGRRITLDTTVLGTGHGLSKVPYIRDTRRSVGLDDFVLTSSDLRGPASQVTGKRFRDRIAIGAYAMDIHGLSGCRYPSYVQAAGHETLPFFVPFRALTNRDVSNLLVAGKTMAQSFLANAATRLHPIEWATGTAAGAASAHMAKWGLTSRAALVAIDDIQTVVRAKTPIDWTIGGATYPRAGEGGLL